MENDDILSEDFHQKKYINFLIKPGKAKKNRSPAKYFGNKKKPTLLRINNKYYSNLC